MGGAARSSVGRRSSRFTSSGEAGWRPQTYYEISMNHRQNAAPERRYHSGGKPRLVQTRSGNSPGTVVGYAVVFNSRSEKLGGAFYETIDPSAFDGSISDPNVRALYEHLTHGTLGKQSAGTLRLSKDSKGILAEIVLPNTTYGRDAAESVRRGDIDGMSFGFGDADWEWSSTPGGDDLGHVTRGRLFEVTLTSSPAYRATSAQLQSAGREGRAAPAPGKPGGGVLSREQRLKLAEHELAELDGSKQRERQLRLAEAEMSLLSSRNFTKQLEPAIEDRCAKHSSVRLLDKDRRPARERVLRHRQHRVDANPIKLTGQATRFGVVLNKADGRRSVVSKYAFDESLRQVREGTRVVELRLGHNPDAVLASTADGDLKIWTTEHGLFWRAYVSRRDLPEDILITLEQGGQLGSSFSCTKDAVGPLYRSWAPRDREYEILRAGLEDVCIARDPVDPLSYTVRTFNKF